jgi:hypothetical protein
VAGRQDVLAIRREDHIAYQVGVASEATDLIACGTLPQRWVPEANLSEAKGIAMPCVNPLVSSSIRVGIIPHGVAPNKETPPNSWCADAPDHLSSFPVS